MRAVRLGCLLVVLSGCVPAELFLSGSEAGADGTKVPHDGGDATVHRSDAGPDARPPGDAEAGGSDVTDASTKDAGPPCSTYLDCPVHEACDPTSHTCSTSCAGNLLCNSGCCNGTSCEDGTKVSACGSTGGACVACGGDTPTCAAGECT